MSKNNKVIDLVKLNGAGNSFVIIENINDQMTPRNQLAQLVCRLDLNGKTDGLLFVEKLQPHKFKWDFYNSDGSTAEMCGNAARCVTRYLSEKENLIGVELEIQTLAGSVFGKMISASEIEIKMPPVIIENFQDGFQRINTGVPHLIYPIENIKNVSQNKEHARELRHKWNANVTFVASIANDELDAVSFERGVEDFTLACGTGAVAAGVWNILKGNSVNECQINMPGGCLTIKWDKHTEPFLIGNAVIELKKQIVIEV